MSDLAELFAHFVEQMNATAQFKRAARDASIDIQFRVIPHVYRAPLEKFAGKDGDWFCIQIRNGVAELMVGDHRAQSDFKNRVEFEVERETIEELLSGKVTVSQALLADRLIAGGVLAHWAGTLIHLTQTGDKPTSFLPSGHEKGFLR